MVLRATLVLLAILNLGVALWWLSVDDCPPSSPPPPLPAGVARLSLLGERPPAAASPAPAAAAHADADTDIDASANASPADTLPAPTAEPPPPPVADAAQSVLPLGVPPGARCFGFGPFRNHGDAEAVQSQVLASVAGARIREEAGRPTSSHWTVLLPLESTADAAQAQAQAMSRRLAAAGFRDNHVIAAGAANGPGVAAGRFSSQEAAQRHLQALAKAGFRARLIAPPAPRRYWLEVVAGPDFEPSQAQRAIGAQRMREIDCARLG